MVLSNDLGMNVTLLEPVVPSPTKATTQRLVVRKRPESLEKTPLVPVWHEQPRDSMLDDTGLGRPVAHDNGF